MKNKTRIHLLIIFVILSLFVTNCYQTQITHTPEENTSNTPESHHSNQSQINYNPEELIAKVDEYINALVNLDRFSGSVLISHDGDLLISKGYGMANREHNIPNTPQTKFRLASITKQFTSMIIMILQEEGKLHVHDSICKYVPDCPELWQDITIHHLMTHTSGIPNFQNFPDNLQYERLPTTVENTVERFKHKELKFTPGVKIRYSSSGYVLLGYIIEQVTGKSYEEVINQYIFGPLEMNNSGYDHPRTILMHRAAGYSRENNQFLNAIHFEMDTPHAAGALYSTVEDLFLWDQALYTTQLVSQETHDTIFTEQIKIGEGYGYGYGWMVTELFSRKLARHNGNISGFRTIYSRFPDDKVGIITLSNFEFADIFKINRDLSAIIFNEKYELPK